MQAFLIADSALQPQGKADFQIPLPASDMVVDKRRSVLFHSWVEERLFCWHKDAKGQQLDRVLVRQGDLFRQYSQTVPVEHWRI